jgi:predicted acetyltransferase
MQTKCNVRQLNETHYLEYARIWAEAYPGAGVFTPEEIEKRIERLRLQIASDNRITMYGAFRGDSLLGIMLLYDLTMNLHGTKVLAGGVGNVAVHLMHKKEHVAWDLVQFYTEHYDQRNSPLLALWPFRHNFYRDMGFGLGTKIYRYEIKPEDLPRDPSKSHVRFLNVDDVPALVACINRLAAKHNGMAEENEGHWRLLFANAKRMRVVGFERDSRIEGFVAYHCKANSDENFIDNDIIATNLIYETPDALSELLSFLHSQADQINRIVLSTSDEDFQFLLQDLRNRSGVLIPSVFHESNVTGNGLMYRVLNCRRAFETMAGHDFGGVSLKLKLTTRDTFYPKYDGSIVVAFSNGRATVTDTDKSDVEISMNIAEFSSLFMGAVDFRTLYTYKLAQISDAAYVDVVDRAFACSEKPVCHADF